MIMVSLMSALFGCSGKRNTNETTDVYPKESFSVLKAQLNGKPVIGSFNMAYKDYGEKEKYSWSMIISIGLDSTGLYDNGLPKPEESAVAEKLEDQLVDGIKKITTAHYIGHLFNDTFLDIYIYTNEPKKVDAFLQTQANNPSRTRPFAYKTKNDPNWSIVSEFLK